MTQVPRTAGEVDVVDYSSGHRGPTLARFTFASSIGAWNAVGAFMLVLVCGAIGWWSTAFIINNKKLARDLLASPGYFLTVALPILALDFTVLLAAVVQLLRAFRPKSKEATVLEIYGDRVRIFIHSRTRTMEWDQSDLVAGGAMRGRSILQTATVIWFRRSSGEWTGTTIYGEPSATVEEMNAILQCWIPRSRA